MPERTACAIDLASARSGWIATAARSRSGSISGRVRKSVSPLTWIAYCEAPMHVARIDSTARSTVWPATRRAIAAPRSLPRSPNSRVSLPLTYSPTPPDITSVLKRPRVRRGSVSQNSSASACPSATASARSATCSAVIARAARFAVSPTAMRAPAHLSTRSPAGVTARTLPSVSHDTTRAPTSRAAVSITLPLRHTASFVVPPPMSTFNTSGVSFKRDRATAPEPCAARSASR